MAKVTSDIRWRAAAFAVVLVISSGLILGLLQEARAITVEFTSDAQASITSTTVYTVDITVPDGQRVPINDIAAILEAKASTSSDKSGATLVSRAVCPMLTLISGACPTDGAFTSREGSTPTAITKVALVSAYQITAASGYELTDTTTFFGYGTYTGTTTGYGYDTISPQFDLGRGYGYGYTLGTGQVAFSDPNGGYGYGYSGAALILRFQVTVAPSEVGAGTFYLTLVGVTGSSIVGDLSSPFFTITVSGGGGGSGSGAVTTTPTTSSAVGTGAGQTQTITATSTTPPAGATAAFTATVATGSSGNTVVINTGDTTFPTVTLLLDGTLTNAQISIVSWPASTAPPGSPALPAGFDVGAYLQVTITSGGDGVGTATLTIKLQPSEVPNANQGVLLHNVNNAWNPESRIIFTLSGGVYTGTATTPCCSTFAVGFDTESPQVAVTAPSGDQTGTVTITATATDNLRVSSVEWQVDGVTKETDTAAPYELSLDTMTLNNGAHTVKAIASDYVDNKADASAPVAVNNIGNTPTPTSTVPPVAEPGTGGGIPSWVWLLIGLVIVGLIVGAIVMAGKKPKT